MSLRVLRLSFITALATGTWLGLHTPPLAPGGPVGTAVMAQESRPLVRPFTIAVPDAVLADLRSRLSRARFPDEPEDAGWDLGTNLSYLKELVTYWRDEFDWHEQQRQLNRFNHYTTNIDGLDIHFVHQRSANPDALPLIITHGWPGSFWEFSKIIEPLVDPAGHGGDPDDAFHVVVPSIPGYGFSEKPNRAGYGRGRTAQMFATLMARLGYTRYGAQGGDIGAGISAEMARRDPDHMIGLHLNFCGGSPPDPTDPTAGVPADELRLMRERQAFWTDEEQGYFHIQGTKPQTLGFGLNDSPVGLAAWIIEKYRSWCDCDGDPETTFTKDELLTNIMIYWVTQTATSAARYYYEARHDGSLGNTQRVEIPTGCAAFPKELMFNPRRWVETRFNLTRYTIMPSGGHFAALEEPDLLVDDLRAFFRDLR